MIKLTINHLKQSKHPLSLHQNDISQNKHVQNDTLFVEVEERTKRKSLWLIFLIEKVMYSYSGISTNTSHTIFWTKINEILLNMLNEMVVDQHFCLIV
jgi:hypothetical protein